MALVFPNRRGGYIDATNIHRWFTKAATAAGAAWATPHTLRHSCLTLLLNSGMNVKAVQVWAGHTNAAVLLTTYAHLVDADLPESPFAGNALGTMPAETSRDDDAGTNEETAGLRVIPA